MQLFSYLVKSKQRNSQGSIFTFLALLGAIVLMIILGLISLELLTRWVSLGRVQNAANEAALVYARDVVRLRDQALSKQNKSSLTFSESGISYSHNEPCTYEMDAAGKCTRLSAEALTRIGENNLEHGSNTSLEYLNASRTLMFNIWGKRIEDILDVDNVQQNQCYKPYLNTRFSLFGSGPRNEESCTPTGKVTSPIMYLKWNLTVNNYGEGVCCSKGLNNDDKKDFCVDVGIKGRMDPVMAGGLPFIQNLDFIKIGEFNVHGRAIAYKQSASGVSDVITNEEIPQETCSPAAPELNPLVNSKTVTTEAFTPYVPEPLEADEVPAEAPEPSTFPPACEVSSCPACYFTSRINVDQNSYCNYNCSPCPQGVISKVCAGNAIRTTEHDGCCGQRVTTQACGQCTRCINGGCQACEGNGLEISRKCVNGNVEITEHDGCCGTRTQIQNCPSGCENSQCKSSECVIVQQLKAAIEAKDNRTSYDLNQNLLKMPVTPARPGDMSQECLEVANSEEGPIYCPMRYGNACYKDNSKPPQGLGDVCKGLWIQDKDERPSRCSHWKKPYIITPDCRKVAVTSYYYHWYTSCAPSPISFQWSKFDKLKAQYAKFPLDPTSADKWFEWYASESWPLLVYDPEKKGNITSAAQLFGNFTFGKEWENGYKALKILDEDNSGYIESDELKPLSLWFDRNRNGVSEKGEVQSVQDLKVIRILVEPNEDKFNGEFVYASEGYEKKVQGELVKGLTIDWYSHKSFASNPKLVKGDKK
ncbi:MAG TPA: hypothetical protein V6C96_01070 [Vampirovibrionales bacterium]